MIKTFLIKPKIAFITLTKLFMKNGLKKLNTHILRYVFLLVNLFLINIINKKERLKNCSGLVKKMKCNMLKIPYYFIA